MTERIFALDIGTRTVVGLFAEKNHNGLKIVEAITKEHQNRSMLDGQIHNVLEVTEVVREIKNEMEERLNMKLKHVVVAAAGRALKTISSVYKRQYNSKVLFTPEQIRTMEFAGVQEAQKKLASAGKTPEDYHFVGYSVTDYNLDGIELNNLAGQQGSSVKINLLATFLPRIVIDSLLTVVSSAGLKAVHMTLEPIAAAELIIPKSLQRLNLVLIDIGAGTSDIALSQKGKITAYGMVPKAGDEITESLSEKLLLDFPEAESVKRQLITNQKVKFTDILGQKKSMDSSEIIELIREDINELAGAIAEEIKKFTSPEDLHAIICIGGGSLTPHLPSFLAQNLNIPQDRVGVRSSGELRGILGQIQNLHPAQSITPIGIALSYLNSPRANFLDVQVNNQPAHIFTLDKPMVSDALLSAGIDMKKINGKTGLALTVEINNKLKIIPGTPGTEGKIFKNGEPASLDTPIQSGDKLEVIFGENGRNARGTIRDIVDVKTLQIEINGHRVKIEPEISMNGKIVDLDTEITDGCKIKTKMPQTAGEILSKTLNIKPEDLQGSKITCLLNNEKISLFQGKYRLRINDRDASPFQEIKDGDRIEFKPFSGEKITINKLLEGIEKPEFRIEFNGETITAGPKNWDVTKNGKHANINDFVFNGDKITAKPRPLQVNEFLEMVDYRPPASTSGSLIIKRNGEKVSFTAPLKSGDSLEIYFSQSNLKTV